MDREQVTEQVSSTLTNFVFRGTSLVPFVQPDADEVVRRIDKVSGNTLHLQEPDDFFDLHLPVTALDRAAKDYTRKAQLLVAGSGVATGFAGLPGIAPDIAVLVSATIGLVRRHALVYGFTDIEANPDDKLVLLTDFAAATGAEAAIKQTATLMGRAAGDVALKLAARRAAEMLLARQISVVMAVQMVRQAAKRAIPVVSSATGAALNVAFLGTAGSRSAGYWRERHMIVRQARANSSP